MSENILYGNDYKGPGLTGRLIIVVLCLFVLVFGAYTYWQLTSWITQAQVTQVRSGERVLSDLSLDIKSRLQSGATNYYPETFYKPLLKRYIVRNPYVREISFKDTDGRQYTVLTSQVIQPVPELVEDWLIIKEQTLKLAFKKSTTDSKLLFGHLSLQLNTAYTRSKIWANWVNIAIIVSAITLFFVLIMLQALRTNVRVLRALVSLGDQVAEGNFKVRVEEGGSAEVRAAGQTINQLAALMENMSFSMSETKKSLQGELKRVEKDNVEAGIKQETAEVANQTKTEYLSNVSEEFRTPLTSIMSLSEMMMKPEYKSQQRHFSEMIHASAIHLLNYINNVLNIAQLETAEVVAKKDIFDFRSIFREVNEMLMPYAAHHHKIFNMMLDNDIPYYVISDAPRIKQLILSTACDVIANGKHSTVFMKCHVQHSTVLSLNVQFEVYANDSNTEAATDFDWTKVNEAQADNRVCELYGKAGVGLPVARKVVAALEGELKERSYQEQDHSFIFTMALERPSETKVMEHEQQLVLAKEQSASHRTLKILLAESHQINRYVYELVFFHRGHVTVKVDNGLDALKRLQEEDFDFAILDQQMPGMSGHDVAQKLRELEIETGKHLPIMIVSSDAKEQTISDCRRYAELTEVKPVSPYTLIDEVEHFIDNPEKLSATVNFTQRTAVEVTPEERERTQELLAEFETAPEVDELLDLHVLNNMRQEVGDDKIDQRIRSFYTLFEAEFSSLKAAMYKGDRTAYLAVTDRISGDTAKIGARALKDQFSQLKNMDSSYVLDNSENVLEAIAQVYADTREAYQRHMK